MREMPLLEHVSELRKRIIFVGLFFIAAAALGIAVAPEAVIVLSGLVPEGSAKTASLSPLEMVHTQIKVGLIIALALSMPAIIYHMLVFIGPAATPRELSAIRLVMPAAALLFGAGMAAGTALFSEVFLRFLAMTGAASGVENLWSIGKVVSFIIWTGILSGLAFLMPLLMLLLNRMGILKRKSITGKRAFAYAAVFAIAAVVSPPDVFSQIIVAVPAIIIIEITLLLMR